MLGCGGIWGHKSALEGLLGTSKWRKGVSEYLGQSPTAVSTWKKVKWWMCMWAPRWTKVAGWAKPWSTQEHLGTLIDLPVPCHNQVKPCFLLGSCSRYLGKYTCQNIITRAHFAHHTVFEPTMLRKHEMFSHGVEIWQSRIYKISWYLKSIDSHSGCYEWPHSRLEEENGPSKDFQSWKSDFLLQFHLHWQKLCFLI